MINFNILKILLALSILSYACKKTGEGTDMDRTLPDTDTLKYHDISMALKDVADFPIGVAVSLSSFSADAMLRDIVFANMDAVTFENEMKSVSIVQNDGSFDFSAPDALLSRVDGLQVHGHTLSWHDSNNATYLNGIVGPTEQVELLRNPGFETGDAAGSEFWYVYNSGDPRGTSTITVGSGSDEVRTGNRSLKVHNPVGYPGNQWRVQVASNIIATVPGTSYMVSYEVKAVGAGGSIMLTAVPEDGATAVLYQGDRAISTEWQTITWIFTANATQTRLMFNLGQAANTYYIDNASVLSEMGVPDYPKIAHKLDSVMKLYIDGMVGRYKDKVRSWDVVNELFTDMGEIRNKSNTTGLDQNGQPKWGFFLWSEYMGRSLGANAFRYAREADPTAELYINEYGLEYSARKTDSLIAYVNELRRMGIKVDGIGSQMHISTSSSKNGIDRMFQKLSATGLKIKISELDVATTGGTVVTTPSEEQLQSQADMYRHVVASYVKFVPKEQRAGITMWGIVDKYTWVYNGGREFPVLFSPEYEKKPAYLGFLQGLRGQ